MAEMSDYLENTLGNAVLRGSSFTSPVTIYVGLFTNDPGDDNSGTEVAGGAYARKAVTFGAPTNGVFTSNADVSFDQATATWGTISHLALFDSLTGGNQLFHTPLDIAKLVETGDIFTVRSGQLTVQFQ